MRVFVSSVMGGFEDYRTAAAAGIEALDFEPVMAETFGALDESSRRACLREVRDADVVLFVLGERYGEVLPEGTSATEQEYREAQDHTPGLVFVQEGIAREARQDQFVAEVQDWADGRFRVGFTTPAELQAAVTRELHRYAVETAAGGADPDEMMGRAVAALPERRNQTAWLDLAVAGGPPSTVLRPAALRDGELLRDVLREATYGDTAVLDPAEGHEHGVDSGVLVVRQRHAELRLDGAGTIVVSRAVGNEGRQGLPALIVEKVRATLRESILHADWLLDHVDDLHRLAAVVPVARLSGAGWLPWRTEAEVAASPNSMSGSLVQRTEAPRTLAPPDVRRANLRRRAGQIAEDLAILLQDDR